MVNTQPNQTYGYVRVSSKDQCEDRQLIALEEFSIKAENIFLDKISGKDFVRPQYQAMLKKIKSNDIIIIKSIDRLGRDYAEILEQWRIITKIKGADIKVLDMPLLDTTRSKDLLGTFIADLVLQLLSFVAQTEREAIHQRQAEGIAAARARGVKLGRPKTQAPACFASVLQSYRHKDITLEQALDQTGMSRSTFYRKCKETDAT